MQTYIPSSASRGHLSIFTTQNNDMQAYHHSTAAHTLAIPASMQAYYPSTAAHNHLDLAAITAISEASTPPPSPTASEIVLLLENPSLLTDAQLHHATLTAQTALQTWQTEYLTNDTEIRRRSTGLLTKAHQPTAHQYEDPTKYEQARNEAEHMLENPEQYSSRGRKLTKTAKTPAPKPAPAPKPKGRKPKAAAPKPKAALNTTIPSSSKPKTAPPKRSAAPKPTAASSSKPKMAKTETPTAPKATNPRSSKPKAAATPLPSAPQPAAPSSSAHQSGPISISKDLQIDMVGSHAAEVVSKRTRQPRKIFESAPSAPKKRQLPDSEAAETAAPAAKKRRAVTPAVAAPVAAAAVAAPPAAVGQKSKSEVMREVWARRKAEGRNGRHGGAPTAGTVAKARARSVGEGV